MFTGSTATGSQDHRGLGRQPRAPHPGARRQRRRNRAARNRPCSDRRRPVLGRIHQHRPDLCRPQAPLRARIRLRRGRSRRSTSSRDDADGQRPRREERARTGAEQEAVRHRLGARRRREEARRPRRDRRSAGHRARRAVLPDHAGRRPPRWRSPRRRGAVRPGAPDHPVQRRRRRDRQRQWPRGGSRRVGVVVRIAAAARAVAVRLQAGTVWINSTAWSTR